MGAWDTGVYENDSALDFMSEMEKFSIREFIEEAFKNNDVEEVRVAADQFAKNYRDLGSWREDMCSDLIDYLASIPLEWFDDWSSYEKEARASVQKQIDQLLKFKEYG